MRIFRPGILALMVLLLWPSAAVAGGDMSLDEANQRWAGATCRSRVPITLTDKRPKDGWTKCEWIFRTPEHGNERVRVLVSDAERLRARYLGGMMPVGTEFVAVGWKTEKPRGRGDLFLELKHAELGALVRVYYGKDWAVAVNVGSLYEFEQWARLSMFDIVESPSERLVKVSRSTPTEAVGMAPAPSIPSGPLAVRVLGTAADPLTVSPGGSFVFEITYDITGLPAGRTVAVLERRIIRRDGQVLATVEATVERTAGIHRSTQSLKIPAMIQPGVLELRSFVRVGEAEGSGQAMFSVRRGR